MKHPLTHTALLTFPRQVKNIQGRRMHAHYLQYMPPPFLLGLPRTLGVARRRYGGLLSLQPVRRTGGPVFRRRSSPSWRRGSVGANFGDDTQAEAGSLQSEVRVVQWGRPRPDGHLWPREDAGAAAERRPERGRGASGALSASECRRSE